MNQLNVMTLDFDGCTHPVSAIEDLSRGMPVGFNLLDELGPRNLLRWWPLLVEVLERHPDVMLMVHSGWRKILTDGQLRGLLAPLQDRFLGSTPRDLARWDSICYTAERFEVSNLLVLDDAVNEFPKDLGCLIECHPAVGLSDPAVLARIDDALTQMSRPASRFSLRAN